jgi:ubiquinone/menaquinone biosynthesis C-methylase UbiE
MNSNVEFEVNSAFHTPCLPAGAIRNTMVKARISESGIIEDRELAEYYNRMARRYMRIPCQRVLKRVLAKGVLKGKAFDVGTGPGVFPIFIAKALQNIQFKGIDLSPVMIDLARDNAIHDGVKDRVEFELGSAYSLPCKDHSIDLLLCINTLHHLEHPVDFFNEAARALKEDGAFVIVDFHRDTSSTFVGMLDLLWKAFFGKHPKARNGFLESFRSSYTLAECRNFLEESSLRDWKLYTRTVEMWIESSNSNPHRSSLPPANRSWQRKKRDFL